MEWDLSMALQPPILSAEVKTQTSGRRAISRTSIRKRQIVSCFRGQEGFRLSLELASNGLCSLSLSLTADQPDF